MDQNNVNATPVFIDNILKDAYNAKYAELHKEIDTSLNKLFENLSDVSRGIKKVLQENCSHFICRCQSVYIYFKYLSSDNDAFKVEFINGQIQITVYSSAVYAINSHPDHAAIWTYECKRLCYSVVERVFNSFFANSYQTAKLMKTGSSNNNYFYIKIDMDRPNYDTEK